MSSSRDKQREQLSAYLDGELSEQEARTVAQAVKADGELAAELERLQAVRELVVALPTHAAPQGLAQRVMARAERARLLDGVAEMRVRPKAPWPVRLARLSAAAVILIAVGVGVTMIVHVSLPPGGPAPIGLDRTSHLKYGRGQVPPLARASVSTVAKDYVYMLADPELVVIIVDTDNRRETEQEIAGVFVRNGVVADRAGGHGYRGWDTEGLASNYFNRSQTSPNEAFYIVDIEASRVPQFVEDLNTMRYNRNFEQIPIRQGVVTAPRPTDGIEGRLEDRPVAKGGSEARKAGGTGSWSESDKWVKKLDLARLGAKKADEVRGREMARAKIGRDVAEDVPEDVAEKAPEASAPSAIAGKAPHGVRATDGKYPFAPGNVPDANQAGTGVPAKPDTDDKIGEVADMLVTAEAKASQTAKSIDGTKAFFGLHADRKDQSYGVFQLGGNAAAKDVAGVLDEVLQDRFRSQRRGGAEQVKVSHDDRSNTVIVSGLDEDVVIVKRLLSNLSVASLEELAEVRPDGDGEREVEPGRAPRTGFSETQPAGATRDDTVAKGKRKAERLRRVKGTAAKAAPAGQLFRKDVRTVASASEKLNVEVRNFKLTNADARQVAITLNGVFSQDGARQRPRFDAEVASNQLVVAATKEQFAAIEQLIQPAPSAPVGPTSRPATPPTTPAPMQQHFRMARYLNQAGGINRQLLIIVNDRAVAAKARD